MRLFPESIRNILVTGGGGFIGGTLVRKLLKETSLNIFNIDKISYASDFTGINQLFENYDLYKERYKLIKINLSNLNATRNAIKVSNPDIIFHLAAESHVDRSIYSPETFIQSNIIGTFNLLEALKDHWKSLPIGRKRHFRLLHVSTDEVFGSLGEEGLFSEKSPYNPRSPYSATKASSDHIVNAWHHTYGLPTIITNCSNNYGPWQFPEKLIPLTILKATSKEKIPIYGDGKNVRDWIFVEDHIEALLRVALNGEIGNSYCIGGQEQKRNDDVINIICRTLDDIRPLGAPHHRFKSYVKDRPGHDRRYGIDNKKLTNDLGWKPSYSFLDGISLTVKWYLKNIKWCERLLDKNRLRNL